jgi:hypothetical protein
LQEFGACFAHVAEIIICGGFFFKKGKQSATILYIEMSRRGNNYGSQKFAMRTFITKPIQFLLFLGAVTCTHGLLRSKQVTYTIAGMSTGNQSIWPARFKPTFETYLNSAVGTKFSPPIQFVLQVVDFISIFATVEKGLADFVYPTSSIFSCLDSEYGLMPLVGIRRSYALNNRKYILNRLHPRLRGTLTPRVSALAELARQ